MIMNPMSCGRIDIRSSRGFTLIELMIVVAVVAILAAIAYPSYQEQVRKTRRTEAKAGLLKTLQLQEKYYTQFNTYLAFTQSTNLANTPFRAYVSDSAATSYYAITAEACSNQVGQTIDACVLLRAIPGQASGGLPFKDPTCETLILNSAGVKSTSLNNGAKCWE